MNAKKSARKSAPGKPFTGAGDPRNGRGPKKGAPNAGRPRNEHLAWCRQMVSDPKCEAAVQAVLANQKHPAFATMWKAVAERGYGKPREELDVTSGGKPLEPQVWAFGTRTIAFK